MICKLGDLSENIVVGHFTAIELKWNSSVTPKNMGSCDERVRGVFAMHWSNVITTLCAATGSAGRPKFLSVRPALDPKQAEHLKSCWWQSQSSLKRVLLSVARIRVARMWCGSQNASYSFSTYQVSLYRLNLPPLCSCDQRLSEFPVRPGAANQQIWYFKNIQLVQLWPRVSVWYDQTLWHLWRAVPPICELSFLGLRTMSSWTAHTGTTEKAFFKFL